jgi:hypothetical protein
MMPLALGDERGAVRDDAVPSVDVTGSTSADSSASDTIGAIARAAGAMRDIGGPNGAVRENPTKRSKRSPTIATPPAAKGSEDFRVEQHGDVQPTCRWRSFEPTDR